MCPEHSLPLGSDLPVHLCQSEIQSFLWGGLEPPTSGVHSPAPVRGWSLPGEWCGCSTVVKIPPQLPLANESLSNWQPWGTALQEVQRLFRKSPRSVIAPWKVEARVRMGQRPGLHPSLCMEIRTGDVGMRLCLQKVCCESPAVYVTFCRMCSVLSTSLLFYFPILFNFLWFYIYIYIYFIVLDVYLQYILSGTRQNEWFDIWMNIWMNEYIYEWMIYSLFSAILRQ